MKEVVHATSSLIHQAIWDAEKIILKQKAKGKTTIKLICESMNHCGVTEIGDSNRILEKCFNEETSMV